MVDDQGEALGQLARVLTGDDREAAALLGEVAVRARLPPEGNEGFEERRGLLVQRVLRRRRPGPANLGPQPAPDPRAGPETPLDPEARLARIEPLGRTLLVLRYGEHLTLAELARLTDRSLSAVTRALEHAEASAGVEPYEVEQLLWRTVAPVPGAVREAERRAAARRRRRQRRIVLVGVAAAGLVAAGTVLPGLLREDPYVRPYGEWTFTAQLGTPGPYTLQSRELTAAKEVLAVTSAAKPDATCTVTVTTASKRVPVPAGRKATLGDRPARFVDATLLADAGLWWSLGPRTSALASCDEVVDGQALLDLAGQVRFARTPVRVPFDLRGLPQDDEVEGYVDYLGASGVVVTPRGGGEESPNAVFVGLIADTSAGAVSGRRVDVNGSAGRMTDDEAETALCWPSGAHTVCAGMVVAQESLVAAQRARRTSRLLQTARAVRLAPDLDRPETWFDAQQSLPR